MVPLRTVLTECLSESRKEKVPRYIDGRHRISWTISNLDSLESPALNKHVHEPQPHGHVATCTCGFAYLENEGKSPLIVATHP